MEKEKTLRLYILTETSLWRLVWDILCGSRPIVLFALPLFRPLEPLLSRILKVLTRRNLVGSLADISPDLPWPARFPLEKNLTHGLMEPILDALQDQNLPKSPCAIVARYVYPMRKAITDYSETLKDIYLIINWLEAHAPDKKWLLYGTPPFVQQIYGLFEQKPLPAHCRTPIFPAPILNLVNSLLLIIAGFCWLLMHSRPVAPKCREYRLIADRVSGQHDIELFRSLVDDPSELLILDRNKQLAERFRPTNGPFEARLLTDARINFLSFFAMLGSLTGDLAVILKECKKSDPQLFWLFASRAVKRYQFAAFFKTCRPRFFWGRDDYSIDHILRNQEVRNVGGQSMGINHGLPINTYASQWREVDFDIYYFFGTHLFDTVYSLTWPATTKTRAVGSVHMTRDYRARLDDARPLDIAFFPVVVRPFEETFAEVFKVARHFSDRKVYVKFKQGRNADRVEQFENAMRNAPPNIILYSDPNPYELLLKITYGICFTTLVAEALQFKVKTFNLDMDPTLEHQYFRNFPGLTVPDGQEIIRRIEAIEAGTEIYDFKQYNSLIRIDGPNIIDCIRSDLQLPPSH